MATKAGSIYTEIRARLDKYERDLAKAHNTTNKAAGKIQKRINKISFAKASASMARFSRLFNTAAVALAGGGALGSLIKISSDYEQSIFQMSQTFQGQTDAMIAKAKDMAARFKYYYDFGDISYAFTKTADSMERYGITGEKYIQLVGRAADIGAAKNLQLKESIDRIESAMRGEAEASEYLGLTLNDTYMKNIAFDGALKNTWETMTDMQKTQARFNELLVQSAKYQGAAEEQAGTLSGALDSLWNAIKGRLNPALEKTAGHLAKIATGMKDLVVLPPDPLGKHLESIQARIKAIEAARSGLQAAGVTGAIPGLALPNAGNTPDQLKALKLEAEGISEFIRTRDMLARAYESSRSRAKEATDSVSAAVKEQEKQLKALTDQYIAALPVIKTYRDSWQAKGERTATDEQIEKAAQLKTAFDSLQSKNINDQLEKEFAQIDQRAAKTFAGLAELSQRTAWSMQQNFSNLFFDAMQGELKSFEDYAMAVFDSIQRAAADIAAQKLTESLFGSAGSTTGGGGWLGALFSGSGGSKGAAATTTYTDNWARFGHSGGIVTAGGFSQLPRFHSGLRSDEFPAVLQRGEAVIPKNKTGAIGGRTEVIINNYAGQPATVRENTDTDGLRRLVIDIAKTDVMRGGQLAQAHENVYGLSRRGRIT